MIHFTEVMPYHKSLVFNLNFIARHNYVLKVYTYLFKSRVFHFDLFFKVIDGGSKTTLKSILTVVSHFSPPHDLAPPLSFMNTCSRFQFDSMHDLKSIILFFSETYKYQEKPFYF